VDFEELARRRQQRRRAAGRAIAWRLHEKMRALPRVTGRPARAFNKLEAQMARLLDEWKVDYKWQFRLGRYVYDFLLPGRLIIEVHGGYIHADPRRYPDEKLTAAQRRTRGRDALKLLYAAERGYRLRVVWERDLRSGRVSAASVLDG
jgi:very-short-patch-repair endonuclease